MRYCLQSYALMVILRLDSVTTIMFSKKGLTEKTKIKRLKVYSLKGKTSFEMITEIWWWKRWWSKTREDGVIRADREKERERHQTEKGFHYFVLCFRGDLCCLHCCRSLFCLHASYHHEFICFCPSCSTNHESRGFSFNFLWGRKTWKTKRVKTLSLSLLFFAHSLFFESRVLILNAVVGALVFKKCTKEWSVFRKPFKKSQSVLFCQNNSRWKAWPTRQWDTR